MDEDTPRFCFQAVVAPHPENTGTHFYLMVKMTLVPFSLGTAQSNMYSHAIN